jgi:hypothetical protein
VSLLTPLGSPQWFNGFCATTEPGKERKEKVVQKPLNHRDKLGGEMLSRRAHSLSVRWKLNDLRPGLCDQCPQKWNIDSLLGFPHAEREGYIARRQQM